jgi:hypothetical protein
LPNRSAALAARWAWADVEQRLPLLDRLVDAGKSVIVVEHHQAVMAHVGGCPSPRSDENSVHIAKRAASH